MSRAISTVLMKVELVAKIDEMQAKVLAKAQIDHIRLFVASADPDLSLLRTFVTNWFAYTNGGPFLNRNGRPRWLNKFHPVKHAILLEACHLCSLEAAKLMGVTGERGDLIVDHAIPFSELRKLLDAAPKTNAGIVQCLKENLRLGVITTAENKKLDSLKLRSSMPTGRSGARARYEFAGIDMRG